MDSSKLMVTMREAAVSLITKGQATDVAAMAAMQPQWRLRYQQLTVGPYEGRISHAALPGLHLTQEASSRAVRQQGSLFEDDIGLALAHSPVGPCRFHGHLADSHVVMVGLGRELDLTMPEECQLLAALMPRVPFLAMMSQSHPRAAERALKGPTTLRLSSAGASHLRGLMQALLNMLAERPEWDSAHFAVRQRQDALVLAWQDVLAGQDDEDQGTAWSTTKHRRELVERACQHVHDSLPHQLPTMLDLCKALGASQRKIEHCFRDVLGISPARYLRVMRLNHVHQDLVQCAGATVTIQDVAARWGFWHMGAFGGDYKRLFGRSPSQTLGIRDSR